MRGRKSSENLSLDFRPKLAQTSVMTKPATKVVRASQLQPGDVLWPTMRTIVGTYADSKTPKGKLEVVWKHQGSNLRSTWGANTTVSILEK
jgi:hypothetical protein